MWAPRFHLYVEKRASHEIPLRPSCAKHLGRLQKRTIGPALASRATPAPANLLPFPQPYPRAGAAKEVPNDNYTGRHELEWGAKSFAGTSPLTRFANGPAASVRLLRHHECYTREGVVAVRRLIMCCTCSYPSNIYSTNSNPQRRCRLRVPAFPSPPAEGLPRDASPYPSSSGGSLAKAW